MAFEPESPSPLDSLRQEYARVFRDWDGLTRRPRVEVDFV